MAKLKLPENCCLCGQPLQVGDKIEFTRRATIVESGYYKRSSEDRGWRRVWVPTIAPRVQPTSPRDVRHRTCPDG